VNSPAFVRTGLQRAADDHRRALRFADDDVTIATGGGFTPAYHGVPLIENLIGTEQGDLITASGRTE
jgi:hypothetical protein